VCFSHSSSFSLQVIWCAYPLIFVLRWTDVLSGFNESITFVCLDFFAKGLFGVLIVGSREVIEGHNSCEALIAMALMGLKPDAEGHIVRRASMIIPDMGSRSNVAEHSYVECDATDGHVIKRLPHGNGPNNMHAGHTPAATGGRGTNGGLGLASPNAIAASNFAHYASFFNNNGNAKNGPSNNNIGASAPRTPRSMIAQMNEMSAANNRHPSMRTVDLGVELTATTNTARSASKNNRFPQIQVQADGPSDEDTAREDEVAVPELHEHTDSNEDNTEEDDRHSDAQPTNSNRFNFRAPSSSSDNPMTTMEPHQMQAMMHQMMHMMASSNKLNNLASPLPVSRAGGMPAGSPKYPAQSPGGQTATAASTRGLLRSNTKNGATDL
jgi:hypothetical protein